MFFDQDGNEITMKEFLERLSGDDARVSDQTDTTGQENGSFRANRAYLVDRVLDNMGEEVMTTEEVVQSADVLFQYIMHGKVPE